MLDNDWAAQLHPGCTARLCRSCGRIVCVCCFHKKTHRLDYGSIVQTSYTPDCIICSYEIREQKRATNVFLVAATNRLYGHMVRERNNQGLHHCRTLAEYQLLTGCTVTWLSEEKMRPAWETNAQCGHCETVGRASRWQHICPVIEGIPDLTRMTIDRIDQTRRIDRDNLRLMCLSGNIARNDTDEATDAIRNAYWRFHNQQRRARGELADI